MKTTILFSSVGRRTQLIQCFRCALKKMGLEGYFVGIDATRSAPAAHFVDEFIHVPRCDAPNFVEIVSELCRVKNVALLLPIIDAELLLYALRAEEFANFGTRVAISSPGAIDLCLDKRKSNRWLTENGFPTVRQTTIELMLRRPEEWRFPLIAKPRCGSASVGVRVLRSMDSAHEQAKESLDLIVEEIAEGDEYTVNAFVNRSGRCVCAVPHHRLEVRAGEVSKGITAKNAKIMRLITEVVERMPGAYGPLNVQGFLAKDGVFKITEINPRFGGGYPLAHEAGVDFPRWLLDELLNFRSVNFFEDWQDGLAMLRYDSAVFLPVHQIQDRQS